MRKTTCTVALGLFLLAAPLAAAEDPLLAESRQKLARMQDKIGEWKGEARTLLILTLSVAALGAAATAVQALHPKRSKPITVVIGAVISILTVVNTTVYKVDHRTYELALVDAQKIADDVDTSISSYIADESPANRMQIFKSIIDQTKEFSNLERRIKGAPDTGGKEKSLVPVVYAAQAQADREWLSFVGRGECNLLSQARNDAFQDAVEKAALYLRDTVRVKAMRLDALREYVVNAASADYAPPVYDKASRTYLQQARLQLNRSYAREDAVRWLARPAASLRPRPEIEERFTMPADFAGTITRKVAVVARDPKRNVAVPKDGSFAFELGFARRGPAQVEITLVGLEIHEDGSPLSARWSFEVQVDGAPALEAPMKRYDDAGRPTRCRYEPKSARRATVSVTPGRNFEVRVLGYKP